MSSKADFISEARQIAADFLSLRFRVLRLQETYGALGLGTEITDSDFTGNNADLIAVEFKSAIADLLELLDTNVSGDHKTNLHNIAP